LPQVFVSAKSPALAPVREILGDIYSDASLVAQSDLLGETLGSHWLVAEFQAGWGKLYVRARAFQANPLWTERSIVRDGERAGD
jgi:hypothetical protein